MLETKNKTERRSELMNRELTLDFSQNITAVG